jgi:DNA-binding CsgD family transcriptional regulator/predicted ArsR family transcriptional regulator
MGVTTPGLEALVQDATALSLWERLRRGGRTASAADLAQESGLPVAEVVSALDRLQAAGLVEWMRAARGRRMGGYRVATHSLDGHLNGSSPQVLDARKRLHRVLLDHNDRVTAASVPMAAEALDRDGIRLEACDVTLSPLEHAELNRRLDAVTQFVDQLQRRGSSTSGGRGTLHLHVTIRCVPMEEPPQPMPPLRLGVGGSGSGADGDLSAATRGVLRLSPREREVALALLEGRTLNEVAEHLGLSFYTVDTLVRRIYRKMGVRRRTEFVVRMRDAAAF